MKLNFQFTRILLCCIIFVVAAVPAVAATPDAVAITDVEVSPEQPAPNEPAIYYVTVENNADSIYEIDKINIDPERIYDPDPFYEIGGIPPGESIQIPISVKFDNTGLHRTQVVVEGDIGTQQIIRRYPAPVIVRDRGPHISLSTEEPTVNAGTELTVHVTNGEEKAVQNVVLTVQGENIDLNTTNQITPEIPGEEEWYSTFRYIPQSVGKTDLTAELEYTTNTGYTKTITESLTVDVDKPSEQLNVDGSLGSPTIQLTGIEVKSEKGHTVITGSASNLGTDPIESVLVRAVETETVTPTNPNRDFFIGTVPGSDFGTFDLTAELSGDATQIPIEVTYISDGNRITKRTEIEAPSTTNTNPDSSSEPSILIYAIGGVTLLAVIGVMGVAIYNSRKDDDGN